MSKIYLLSILILPYFVQAQSKGEVAISKAYDSIMGKQLDIYFGKKFYDPLSDRTINGQRYYRDDSWVDGSISLEGQYYAPVKLRYHIFLDKIIVQRLNAPDVLEVPISKIDYFIIYDTKFIKRESPQPGFYALLHQGSITIIAKYYSTLKKSVENRNMVNELRSKQKYFIESNTKLIPIKSKRSVLTALNDKETGNNLKKFLRREKIFFSQNKEFALRALGKEFEALQN